MTTEALVEELLKETFLIFGSPRVLKSDNGPPFRDSLSFFLEKFGIEHYLNPKKRPTYNGKLERLNEEVRFTVNIASKAADVESMISIIGRSLSEYNYLRPHQALGGSTPYERYTDLDEAIKARIEFIKEQDFLCKSMKRKRTIWIPGVPDPDYVPGKLFIPGNPQNKEKGLIVTVKSKNTG